MRRSNRISRDRARIINKRTLQVIRRRRVVVARRRAKAAAQAETTPTEDTLPKAGK